jgi:FkbM family methyltransferase
MYLKIKNLLIYNLGKEKFLVLSKIYAPIKSVFYPIIGAFIKKSKFFPIEKFKFKFPLSSSENYVSGFRGYELSERNLVKKYVHKNDTILELGGSVGVISCFSNQILTDKTRHIVVEPNPNVIPFLNLNKEENSCEFTIEQCIVSSGVSEIDFYIYKSHLTSSVYSLKESDREKISVKSITIDKLSEKHNLAFNTLIMDIEGFEYNFLLENKINFFSKMIIEFHPDILGDQKITECKNILLNNSFKLEDKIGQVEVWIKKSNI